MAEINDVTPMVSYANPDDEMLPLIQCVCGAKYAAWDLNLSVYPEHADPMPCCGRKLYFSNDVRVLELRP